MLSAMQNSFMQDLYFITFLQSNQIYYIHVSKNANGQKWTCMFTMKKNLLEPCTACFCNYKVNCKWRRIECRYWIKNKWLVSTWTIPPGRPPRSSSRLSDLSLYWKSTIFRLPMILIRQELNSIKFRNLPNFYAI